MSISSTPSLLNTNPIIPTSAKNTPATREGSFKSFDLNTFSEWYSQYNPSLDPFVTPSKMLGNTSLGFAIRNTPVEGWCSRELIKFFNSFSNYIENNPLFINEQNPIEITKKIDRDLQSQNIREKEQKKRTCIQKISSLPPGESYVLDLGWKEHAVTVRFFKRDDDHYDVFVYNAQSGSETLTGGRITPQDKKAFPFFKFENIESKNLLLDILINNLIDQTELDVDEEYGITEYLKLFTHLSKRKVPSQRLMSENPELLIAVQKGGNCTVKSLRCCVFDLIKTPEQYKKWDLSFRYYSILLSYQFYKKDPSRKNAFMLQQAISRLSLAITNDANIHNLDTDSCRAAIENLNRILDEVNHFLSIKEKRKPIAKTSENLSESKERLEKLRSLGFMGRINPQQVSSTKINYNIGKECTWQDLGNHLSKVKEIIKFADSSTASIQYGALLNNLRQLKFQSPLDDVNKNRANLNLLCEVFNLFINNTNNSKFVSSEQNALMETVAIARILASAIDKKMYSLKGTIEPLENYGIDYSLYQQLSQHTFFHALNPQDLEHRNELLSYFSNLTTNKKTLFQFINAEDFSLDDLINGKKYPEGLYHKQRNLNLGPQEAIDLIEKVNVQNGLQNAHFYRLKEIALLTTEALLSRFYQIPSGGVAQQKRIHAPHCFERYDFVLQRSTYCYYNKGCISVSGVKLYWDANKMPTQATPAPEGFTKELEQKYKYSTQSAHIRKKIDSENYFLTNLQNRTHFFDTYLKALTVPAAEVSVLLQELDDKISVSTKEELKLLPFLLHKTLEDTENTTTSPLFAQLRTDPTILERLESLTEKAFALWSQDKDKIDHLLLIFELRASLVKNLRALNPQNKFPKSSNLNKYLGWISKKLESYADKFEIACPCYLRKIELLMESSLEQITPQELADLFLSLTEIKVYESRFDKFKDKFLLSLKRYHTDLSIHLDALRNKEHAEPFAMAVLNQVEKDFPTEKMRFEVNEGSFIIYSSDGRKKVILELDSLKVTLSSGHSWRMPEFNAYKNQYLNRIFKNDFPADRKYGQKQIQFVDPVWGDIRITYTNMGEKVERYEPDTKHWSTYYAPSQLRDSKLHLNDALLFDHAAWIDNETKLLSICNFKGKKLYATNEQGELFNILTGYKFSRSLTPSAVLSFEDSQQVCHWSNSKGERYLTLPRFSEKPLFHWDPQTHIWIYNEDPSFQLDEDPDQDLFDTTLYLHLKSKVTGERLVLIPNGDVTSTSFSKSCPITIKPTNQDENINSLKYFTYEINNRQKLEPTSLNSALYLVLISLSQKEYSYALNILNNISMTDVPDDLSYLLLNKIIMDGRSRKSWGDTSPKLVVVQLKAYLTLRNLCTYSPKLKELLDNLKLSWKDYLIAPKKYEKKLKLTREEEEIITTELNNADVNRFNFLAGKPYDITILKSSNTPNEVFYENNTSCEVLGRIQRLKVARENVLSYQFSSDPWQQSNAAYYRKEVYSTESNLFSSLKPNSSSFQSLYQKILSEQENREGYDRLAYIIAHDNQYSLSSDQKFLLLYCVETHRKGQKNLLPQSFSCNPKEFCTQLINLQIYFPVSQSKFVNKIQPGFSISSNSTNKIQTAPSSKAKIKEKDAKKLHQDFLKAQNEISPPICEQKYKELKNKYLTQNTSNNNNLASNPKENLSSVDAHKTHYETDREIATQKQKARFHFKNNVNSSSLLIDLENEIQRSLQQEENLVKAILKLIETPFGDNRQQALHVAHRMGINKPLPTVDDICKAIADFKTPAINLRKLLPALSSNGLATLTKLAIELMTETTHLRHIKHVKHAIEEGKTQNELAEILSMERQYPTTDLFSLFFEWKSGFRVRENQKILVDKTVNAIRNNDHRFVFQLIMGGGKSSAIISALFKVLELVTDRVPCMLAHHSQKTAALGNLKKFQKTRFDQDLITLDVPLQELSSKQVVRELIARFEKARNEGKPPFMTSSFPLQVILKFIIECGKFNGKDFQKTVIPDLAEFITLLLDKSVFCFDEIDLTLSILTDVRIPIGNIKNLPADEADLVCEIYKFLLSPILKDEVGLVTNDQAELRDKIPKLITPRIAEHLFSSPLFDFKEVHKDAFIRHLLEEIPLEDQNIALGKIKEQPQGKVQIENVAFLKELFSKINSGNRVLKRQAELYGVARFLLTRSTQNKDGISGVLETALSKSYKRNYGYPKVDKEKQNNAGREEHQPGNVIPYLSADTPAITEFGNPYLHLCLSAQAVVQEPITKDEVKFLNGFFERAGKFYSEFDDKAIDKTAEGKQWKSMTGCELSEMTENAFEEALKYINDPNHLERRIAFRKEVIPFNVFTFEREAVMTAVDLAHFVHFGCSGTLYNSPTYYGSGEIALDSGTEGKIINAILRKVLEGRSSVVSIKEKSLDAILSDALQLPSEQKPLFGGIIDLSAFLKKEKSNYDAAQKLLRFFEEHPEFEKEAIVYLHHFSPTDESFVILKKGMKEPIRLKSTTADEILRHVHLKNVFNLWAEPTTTGTDLPMAGSFERPFFSYVSMDSKSPLRNDLQGSLRERKALLDAQEFRFVYDQNEEIEFVKSISDLDQHRESIAKTMHPHSKLSCIETTSFDAILKDIKSFSVDQKRQIAGIIDTGNLLDHGEAQLHTYAKQLLQLFQSDPSFGKKGVFYFDGKGGYFYLKDINKSPVALKKPLEMDPTDLENAFYIFNSETAKAFPPVNNTKPKAFSYMTLSPSLQKFSDLQGNLAEQEFYHGTKNFHFAYAKNSKPRFLEDLEMIKIIIDSGIVSEAKSIETQTVRSIYEGVESILKWDGLKKLLDASLGKNGKPQNIPKIFQKYEDVLCPRREYSTYQQWLMIKETAPLENCLSQLHAETFRKEPLLQQQKTALIEEAKKNPFAPKELPTVSGAALSSEVMVEVAQQVEIDLSDNREQLKEIQQELLQELEAYQSKNKNSAYVEKDWCKSWVQGQLPSDIIQVSKFLRKSPTGKVKNTKEFASCFSYKSNPALANLYLTNNLCTTYTGADIAVFDKKFKKTHFALVIRDDKNVYHTILLSKQDKERVTQFLENKNWPNVWVLGLLHGKVEFGNAKDEDLLKSEILQDQLWYGNLFNGNIGYITEKKELTKKITSKESAKKALFGQYFLLKTAESTYDILRTVICRDLRSRKLLEKTNDNKIVFSERRKLNNLRYLDVQNFSEEQIRDLSPDSEIFEDLGPHQVQYLHTKDQINGLRDDLLKELSIEQLKLLNLDRYPLLTKAEHIQSLDTPEKVQALGTEKAQLQHILPKQYPLLSDEQLIKMSEEKAKTFGETEKQRILTYLKDPEKMKDLEKWTVQILTVPYFDQLDGKYAPFLSDTQVDLLEEKHVHLVKNLDVGQIKRMKPEKLIILGTEKVKEFKDQELIQRLIHPPQIQALLSNQVPLIKTTQIDSLKDDQLLDLSTAHGEALSGLNKARLIQHLCDHVFPVLAALPSWTIHHFEKAQFDRIPAKYWPSLSDAQLNQLDSNDPNCVDIIKSLTNSQLGRIRDPKKIINEITEIQIQKFDYNEGRFIEILHVDKLVYLQKNSLINLLPIDRMGELIAGKFDQFIQALDPFHKAAWLKIYPPPPKPAPIRRPNPLVKPLGFSEPGPKPQINLPQPSVRPVGFSEPGPKPQINVPQPSVKPIGSSFDPKPSPMSKPKPISTSSSKKPKLKKTSKKKSSTYKSSKAKKTTYKTNRSTKTSLAKLTKKHRAKNGCEWTWHAVYGIGLSALSIPLIPIELIFNSTMLSLKTIAAICSKHHRKTWSESAENTFLKAPKKRLLSVVAIVNYPQYLYMIQD